MGSYDTGSLFVRFCAGCVLMRCASSSERRGFTLIEIVAVLGIFIVSAAMIALGSARTESSEALRDTTASLTMLLMHARSQSLARVCGGASCSDAHSHGVEVASSSSFVLFEGDSFATRDASEDVIVEYPQSIEVQGASEIVFAAGSATVSEPGTLTLIASNEQAQTIDISRIGRISW